MAANENNPRRGKPFEMTRTFNAPRELVWQAWSEARHLEKWWGPKGCKLHVERHEFRPGGFFHYAMQYTNTPPMWGRFMYRETAAPERIVWLNSFSNEACGITRAPFSQDLPLEIENTVTFTELTGQTAIALSAVPHGETQQERAVFEGMFASFEQGYGGTLDQLAAHLAVR